MESHRIQRFSLVIFFLGIAVFLFFSSCSNQSEPTQTLSSETQKNPLFTLLDSAESGFYFVNEVEETPQMNILVYEYLYNGGGVALGDINNDGLQDVFMVGNLFGGRLFVNKGDLKFEQISETAGVFFNGWSTGVSMIDINEDGYDDIYICRSLAGNTDLRRNLLLVNNKDNTFTNRAAEYGLDDPSFSNYATWFDFDNDGDLDMYLLNHRIDFHEAQKLKFTTNEKGDRVRYKESDIQYFTDKLYENTGQGKFRDITQKAGLVNRTFGLSVTTADINQDGWTDLYVANDFGDKDHFYINNGDGTFSDKIDDMFFHMSKNAMGSDIADFNNDGLLDLINLDMMAEDNYRQKQLKGQVPYDLYQLAVDYGLGHQVMRNTLQLNNGNGTFSEIGQLASVSHTDWSWSPLLADFDNDGLKDLFISNGFYRDLTDMDYINYTSAELARQFGGNIQGHALELTQSMKSNKVANYIYKNNGDLTFTDRSEAWGMNQPSFSNGAVYADLDLDGDLDLITNNFNGEAFLYRNNAQEQSLGNYLSIKLNGPTNNPDGVGSKVTINTTEGLQYQEVSPYRGFFSSGSTVAHFGLGKARSAISVTVTWPNGLSQTVRNVSANQRLELSIEEAKEKSPINKTKLPVLLKQVSNSITKNVKHQEDGFIDFKREPLLEHTLSRKGPFVSKADVNGDGLEDIYLGASAGSAAVLYLQQTGGDFKTSAQSVFQTDKAFEDAGVLFFDVEGDGDQDLFVSSGGYAFLRGAVQYQNRLYINDGRGNFTKPRETLPEFRENSTVVTANDFDRDGDLDLFIGGGALPGSYPHAAKSQLLINEDGKLVNATKQLPESGNLGMINDALWLDINTDGEKELILAGEWMPLKVLRWEGDQLIEVVVSGLENTSGWWNTIKAADMDGDGDLDLIAGNRGENSFYKASMDQPAMIYVKDFDKNGQVDAFPFYYFNDGKSHPKHTLDEVVKQYPNLKKKFTRYAKYSAAVKQDLFSTQELEDALILSVSSFTTTYFENTGDGSFKAQHLPKPAQFSEVHGILPKDLNADGYMDLILTGNNYAADVEAGQHDASIGAVLLGDGKGKFTLLSPLKSGFSVPGDARGVIEIGNILLVLVNNDNPYAFKLK